MMEQELEAIFKKKEEEHFQFLDDIGTNRARDSHNEANSMIVNMVRELYSTR